MGQHTTQQSGSRLLRAAACDSWSCCCLCCLLQAMHSLPHTSSIRWPDQPYNYLRRTFPELSAAGLSVYMDGS